MTFDIIISLTNGVSYFFTEVSKGRIGKNGYLYITYQIEAVRYPPDDEYSPNAIRDYKWKRKQFKLEKIKEMRLVK